MIERRRPRRLEELVRAVRESAVGAGVIDIVGGATKRGWLRAGPTADAVIETGALAGVLEHAHGDLVVTARAGTRLTELQAALAERGQRLALDPPLGPEQGATVGGIFATDDAGPARIAFGSLRELCIGAVVVLADGTVARSGGKVIKNVAGYDLCKLYCGSRGTLGVVAELTLRLHPLPPEELTVRVGCAPDVGARLALALQSGRFSPTGVTHQSGRLWVRFEGPGPLVDAQRALAEARWADAGPVDVLDGPDSRAAWAEAAEGRRGGDGEVVFAASTLPSRVGELARALVELEPASRLVLDPLLGSALAIIPGAPLEQAAARVEAARERALALGGHLRLRGRPRGLDALVDPFGPLPSAVGLMRAVKQRLDPVGRCMPGRYLPRT